MTRCTIYLDESGDLGFKFDAPYRAGGSSRHLTLGAVICSDDANKHIKRFITKFYEARGVAAGHELKWVELLPADRMDFATRAVQLSNLHATISYAAITAYKPQVLDHIRTDPNKLYNYMTGLLLLPVMRRFDEVSLVSDARSVKVKSGNSIHDYLQTKLWFDEGVATRLTSHPMDSVNCRPLHFTDYLCGAFQSFHEDRANGPSDALAPVTTCIRRFFP